MRSLIRRARSAADNDDGSGLILVFFVMLVSSALSLVLLEGAVSMAKQTTANNLRVTSLSAAQAGLDASLGQIRNAKLVSGSGDLSQIPCTVAGGNIGGNGSPSQGSTAGSYTIKVYYYAVDPTAQTQTWRDNSANQINCPAGGHPDKVPTYALLKATGTAGSNQKARSLQTTYIFTTTNQNIAGGLIHPFNDGTAAFVDLCPDAGSAHPAVGAVVTMQPCDPNDQGQLWAYQNDLSFLLTSTTNDSGTQAPMCIEGAGSPSAPKLTVLKMAACTGQPTAGPVSIGQQFSFDDSAHLKASVPNGASRTLGSYCWTQTAVNTAGTALQLTDGCNGYETKNTWRPVASVGAGMSGASTMQLVNYQEFGRCVDATDQDPNHSFMIAFPCKQSPNPSDIRWNQKYTWNSSTGTISTLHDNGTTYCLTSPMAQQSSPTVPGPFVRLNPCPAPASLPNSMKWTMSLNTGNYITSYVIHDSSSPQLCLGLGLTGGSTGSSEAQWDSVYVQTCDGSLEQKWNAPPNTPPGSLTGTTETGTSGG